MRRSVLPVGTQTTSESAVLHIGFLGLSLLVSKLTGLPPACWVGVAGALFICWQSMLFRNLGGRAEELKRQPATMPAAPSFVDGRNSLSSG